MLTQLTSRALLNRTNHLVKVERKTLADLIDCFQEIYNRKLYAEMGYSHMAKFLIKEFQYSESAAYRRVNALRLVKEIPRAKAMISAGKINLSSINELQKMAGGDTAANKSLALEKIMGKSQSETKDALFALYPDKQKHPKPKTEKISIDYSRVSVNLDKSTMDKLDELKATTKIYDLSQLFQHVIEVAHKKTVKRVKKINTVTRPASDRGRYLSSSIQKQLHTRAGGRCQHPGCDERHFLEVDHKIPMCEGGKTELSNLRLLCSAHHKLASREFGFI